MLPSLNPFSPESQILEQSWYLLDSKKYTFALKILLNILIHKKKLSNCFHA